MAFGYGSPIDRRQAITGILAAAGGTLASPLGALAVPTPEKAPEKTYAAFFLGQGGYLFSWGIPYLASQARGLGAETDVFAYSDVGPAWKKIVRRRNDGCKIALVGYSLGNTTITYLQRHLEVDLLLAISESSLGRNHPIKKENTKRSVLWYGPDFLSNAGLKDGFDQVNYVNDLHLWMDVDPRVVRGVLGELKDLVDLEKMDPATLLAKANIPQTGTQTDAPAGMSLAPTRSVYGRWSPPGQPLPHDLTCNKCWGFVDNVAGPPQLESLIR